MNNMEINDLELEVENFNFSEKEIIEQLIKTLNDKMKDEIYGCDLHHYAFNEEHYIENKEISALVLEKYGYKKALNEVVKYEENNFGKEGVRTSEFLANDQLLANMVYYIKSEEYMHEKAPQEFKDILNENWNDSIEPNTAKKLIEILEKELNK